ncbi:MAG TPA: hypothetical protein PKH24_08940 [Sedimentisphaerales bacterium]|nr:hypothetical protein [Sedimentisphaerales bacterium]HNU27572.1 hypothetical protein [Sedimentisphaerales bacterium]
MMQFKAIRLVLVGICLLCGSAIAGSTVTDLIGDKDGFGIGALPGQEFNWNAVTHPDADGTDKWWLNTQSWTHTYDLASLGGSITSAEVEIFHGGDGNYEPAKVYLNGTFIGLLTDSDGSGDGVPAYVTYNNFANVDVFDITAYAYLLTGNDTIEVQTYSDGWVLDYSELTVSGGSVAIPVPGAMALVALGAGLVGSLRRRSVL